MKVSQILCHVEEDRVKIESAFRFGCRFLLSLLVVSILSSSCTHYPTIPRLDELKNAKDAGKARVTQEADNIGEIFQKKAATLISQSEEKENYEIGPEDVLEITVWDNDDLSREVCVSREGGFSYPLIGKVYADGLTVSQLEKRIRDKLNGRFIVDPQVTVMVKKYRSKQVFVIGEVGGPTGGGRGPGTYPLTGKTALVEVISMAGGPTKDAGPEVIVIRHKNGKGKPVSLDKAEKDEIITVNLRRLLEGDTSQNIYLEPNDTIYVPRLEFYFVFGEVKNPGRYILEKGTTVLKAITTASGVTEIAAINKTKVVREKGGAKVEMPVKMTDPIKPEDIIIVPESFF